MKQIAWELQKASDVETVKSKRQSTTRLGFHKKVVAACAIRERELKWIVLIWFLYRRQVRCFIIIMRTSGAVFDMTLHISERVEVITVNNFNSAYFNFKFNCLLDTAKALHECIQDIRASIYSFFDHQGNVNIGLTANWLKQPTRCKFF